MKFYRYSKIKILSKYNFDYKSHYILFIGKLGDRKTISINSFFNIIKGIKLEENHRFILIEEKKEIKILKEFNYII